MLPIVKEMEAYLENIQEDISVAIMGCPVNGPQEASRADIGIAGSFNEGMLFKKGQFVRSIPQADLVKELKKEVEILIKDRR